jgi:GNAT superfamily N-acetyltransferase
MPGASRRFTIRRGVRADAPRVLRLISELARFERLEPPTADAKKRIVGDIFTKNKVRLFIATRGRDAVGYALYFYTYSSFLAKPTLYLEDVFVLDRFRHSGIGAALFRRCAREAVAEGCGRMEWSVLDWNADAIRFYEGMGAKKLDEWSVFRLDRAALGRLTKPAQ